MAHPSDECEVVERERDGFRARIKEVEKSAKGVRAEAKRLKERNLELEGSVSKLTLDRDRALKAREAARTERDAALTKLRAEASPTPAGEPAEGCPGYRKAIAVEPDGTIIFEVRHCATCGTVKP